MQSIINLFSSLGQMFHTKYSGSVDPNLIRFYRTEYGSRWQEELNQHLYNKNQKKGDYLK